MVNLEHESKRESQHQNFNSFILDKINNQNIHKTKKTEKQQKYKTPRGLSMWSIDKKKP
jgi:hypothetical protein